MGSAARSTASPTPSRSFGEGGKGASSALAGISPTMVLIGSAILAAIPVIGVAVGAIGALSAIAFTGGLGLVAFGIAALGSTASLREAAAEVKVAINEYQQALAPDVGPVLQKGLALVAPVLTSIIPVAQAAAVAISGLEDQFKTDLSSSG